MNKSGFADHCVELLSGLGPARAKRMFGGHGLYVNEVFLAVIVEDRLFLKVHDSTRAAFVDAGCTQWVYEGHGKATVMPYFSAPDEAMDSPALMLPWARLAMQGALAAAASRKPAAKKPKAPRKAG